MEIRDGIGGYFASQSNNLGFLWVYSLFQRLVRAKRLLGCKVQGFMVLSRVRGFGFSFLVSILEFRDGLVLCWCFTIHRNYILFTQDTATRLKRVPAALEDNLRNVRSYLFIITYASKP